MAALGRLLAAYSPAAPGDPADRRAAGDAVFLLLEPLARRAAAHAARHLPARRRDDFVADAVTHVLAAHGRDGRPRICAFEVAGATQGRLVCWLRTITRRLLQSERRAARRRPPAAELPESLPSREEAPDAVAARLDRAWDRPLKGHDLAVLAGLAPRLRVLLVAVTTAWTRVPAAVWESWLSDYEADLGRPLARPCPPAALLAADNVNRLFVGLADSLGTTVGTLNGVRYQQLRRFSGVLEYPLDAADPSEAGPRTEDSGRPGVYAR